MRRRKPRSAISALWRGFTQVRLSGLTVAAVIGLAAAVGIASAGLPVLLIGNPDANVFSPMHGIFVATAFALVPVIDRLLLRDMLRARYRRVPSTGHFLTQGWRVDPLVIFFAAAVGIFFYTFVISLVTVGGCFNFAHVSGPTFPSVAQWFLAIDTDWTRLGISELVCYAALLPIHALAIFAVACLCIGAVADPTGASTMKRLSGIGVLGWLLLAAIFHLPELVSAFVMVSGLPPLSSTFQTAPIDGGLEALAVTVAAFMRVRIVADRIEREITQEKAGAERPSPSG